LVIGTARQGERGVLVVDDDVCLRATLADLLVHEGFAVSDASNGYTGLRLATQEHPRVVLLDLMLPELSGVDVLRELRGHADTREIAIIVVTGDTGRAIEAQLAGADLVIEKPFDIDDLVSAVHRAMNQSVAPSAAHVPPSIRSDHVALPRHRVRRRSVSSSRRRGA
jgi:DNA-binding response OmpR family regulator